VACHLSKLCAYYIRGDDANHGPWVDQFIDVRYLDVDSVESRGEINPVYKIIVTDRRVEELLMFK